MPFSAIRNDGAYRAHWLQHSAASDMFQTPFVPGETAYPACPFLFGRLPVLCFGIIREDEHKIEIDVMKGINCTATRAPLSIKSVYIGGIFEDIIKSRHCAKSTQELTERSIRWRTDSTVYFRRKQYVKRADCNITQMVHGSTVKDFT